MKHFITVASNFCTKQTDSFYFMAELIQKRAFEIIVKPNTNIDFKNGF